MLIGGLQKESDYPYVSGSAGVVPTCAVDPSNFFITTAANGKNYMPQIYQGSESTLASHVSTVGPLAGAVDATNWQYYSSGVLTSCGTSLNHAIQLVGVDTLASTPFWKIRNSWGTSWGESGFIRIKYGVNLCHVGDWAVYVSTL